MKKSLKIVAVLLVIAAIVDLGKWMMDLDNGRNIYSESPFLITPK